MKTLYDTIQEGILGNVDDVLDDGNRELERLSVFGKRFKFVRAVCGSSSSGVLNMASLKKLTKDLDYMNAGIEHGYFDKQGKIRMFANWLDHIPFAELGIKNSEDTGDDLRHLFTDNFRKYCEDNDIFNSKNRISMWAVSVAATHGKDDFHIIVMRDDKISNAYAFRLCYKAV